MYVKSIAIKACFDRLIKILWLFSFSEENLYMYKLYITKYFNIKKIA